MKLKAFVIYIMLSPLLPGCVTGEQPHLEATDTSPDHIILICADALRLDRTESFRVMPWVSTWAGVERIDAYATSPWTLPSCASAVTGLMPVYHGASADHRNLEPIYTTVQEELTAAGYLCSSFTCNIHASIEMGIQQGCEYNRQVPRLPAEAQFAQALYWLDRNRDAPTWTWIHLMETHWPYHQHVPDEFVDAYSLTTWRPEFGAIIADRDGTDPFTPAERIELENQYDAAAAYIDAELQQFVDKLYQLDLYADSLIVFFSDHGEEFWEHGGFEHGHAYWQEIVHVPMIVHWPENVPSPIVPQPLSLRQLPDLCMRRRLEPETILIYSNLYGPPTAAVIHNGWKVIADLRHDAPSPPYITLLEVDTHEEHNYYASSVPTLRSLLLILSNHLVLDVPALPAAPIGSWELTLSDEQREQLEALGYIN